MTETEQSQLFSPETELDEMLNVPEIVFIIPYRNREQHKLFFKRYMKDYILKDVKQRTKIVFIHQCDEQPFNRGAMKNIGFKYLKDKFPKFYKDITIVFNDVDTVPYKEGIIDYNTVHGKVKHFYGFKFAFGGIFSIKAGDFEALNGFPNLWGWGFEDNEIQQRWIDVYGENTIDRSTFYPAYDKNILSFFNSNNKLVSDKQKDEYGDTFISNRDKKKNVRFLNGLNTLYEVSYDEDICADESIMVNVSTFKTSNDFNKYSFQIKNLEETNGYKYAQKLPGRGGQIKMLLNTKR